MIYWGLKRVSKDNRKRQIRKLKKRIRSKMLPLKDRIKEERPKENDEEHFSLYMMFNLSVLF